MARIRTIKPQFFRNELLADLSAHHRLLFIGLWTLADRAGRVEDRPRRVQAELFPFEPLNVDNMLDDLVSAGFITRYQVNQIRCIQILNFDKHQNPHPRETPSELPAYEKAANGHDQGTTQARQGREEALSSNAFPSVPSGTSVPSVPSGKDKRASEPDVVIGNTEPPPPRTNLAASLRMTPDEVAGLWNDHVAKPFGLAYVTVPLSAGRINALRLAIRQRDDPEWWTGMLKRIGRSSWLLGKKGSWAVTFDWLFEDDNALRISEGQYDDRSQKQDSETQPRHTKPNAQKEIDRLNQLEREFAQGGR